MSFDVLFFHLLTNNTMDTLQRKRNMDFTYTFIDRLFRLSIGETADFSCAIYNDDYSISLEEAQDRKHRDIVKKLRIGKGSRVLDVGSGWGPILNYIRKIGAEGIGVTLSDGQAKACRANGLDVRIMDFRKLTPEAFGTFDAVTCLGVSGHICTVDEWKAGQQDQVYKDFFKSIHDLLPPGGRFYIDTLVFNPETMLDYEQFDINADRNSDEYILALMEKQFPGSWLAYGPEQIQRNAAPYFKVIEKTNGRLDYVETARQWNIRFNRMNFRKFLLYMKYLPRYVTNREFRHWVSLLKYNPHRVCLERNLMDLYRWVLEK